VRGSGGTVFLVVILIGALAAWNVAPAYFDHYDFVDKVTRSAGCRSTRPADAASSRC
jgi:hypothetical protein